MTSHDQQPDRPTLSRAQQAELGRLVGGAVDGVIVESERVRLNEMLAVDAAARSYYLRYMALHSTLVTMAGNHARHEVDELRRRLSVLDASTSAPLETAARPRLARSLRSVWALAAMLALVALGATVFWSAGSWRGEPSAERQVADNSAPNNRAANNVATRPGRVGQVGRNVARVSYVAPATRWQHPNDSYAVESSVRVGSTLNVAQGEVELVYDTGARLLLIGPAEFLVGKIGGELHRGGLMASVPEAGHGFTIETPHGKVIDLGTEFGVVVDDFGVSEVSVFEGKVEAFPAGLADARTKKIELTKGRALQWSSDTLVSMDADPKRFAVPSTLGFPPSSSRASLDNGFREAAVDAGQWTPLGQVQASSEGLRMEGRTGESRLPYVVSAAEFDPADGPITVVCDVRFPNLRPHDCPSFAILTRSADRRSNIDAPWNDVLATGVRCNFRSDEQSTDGTLETSTKCEPDRELTNISWQGFQRPRADVTYRLVMRDDGVNVSFTVSPVDSPTVYKTVTCRSLFCGYKNHVALEGWGDGAVVVDRVKVFQDPPLEAVARLSTRNRLPSASTPAPPTESPVAGLADLVPVGARLVLEDHFDGPELDRGRWDTLGEVVQRDGRVELGQPVEDAHINTWHSRPYLLTHREFTPADGKLYVLGRIKFADNFLQGYGGSFAVMTRSDDQHGDGPGWEYSVLQTGVRSNFWPAATDHDHNLEIHEKPAPNTISLLGVAGLEIDPDARSYDFCVEDDGRSATITIQDADNPDIRQTLSRSTTTASPRQGFVGLESCWGSPVLLDDVRIYVVPPDSRPDSTPSAGE